MKRMLCVVVLFCLLSVIFPVASLFVFSQNESPLDLGTSLDITAFTQNEKNNETITVLDLATNENLQLSMRDFLIGSVASEMPALYDYEALKAQAVACKSYALASYTVNKQNPDFNGSYRDVNTLKNEGYMTQQAMKDFWGDDYQKNYDKISSCVDEVIDKTCYYNNEVALTCYHAICAGHTENSKNVWKTQLDYLQGVESMLDVTSTDFLQTKTFEPQQLYDCLSINFSGLDFSKQPDQWIKEIIYSEAGYATEIKMHNNLIISAADFRKALDLKSTALEIEYADDRFIITTKGYGHGVGMSQYGANALALTGESYDKILQYYFPNIVIK